MLLEAAYLSFSAFVEMRACSDFFMAKSLHLQSMVPINATILQFLCINLYLYISILNSKLLLKTHHTPIGLTDDGRYASLLLLHFYSILQQFYDYLAIIHACTLRLYIYTL